MSPNKLEALQSMVCVSDQFTLHGENDEATFEAELDEEVFEWVRDKLLEALDSEIRAKKEYTK